MQIFYFLEELHLNLVLHRKYTMIALPRHVGPQSHNTMTNSQLGRMHIARARRRPGTRGRRDSLWGRWAPRRV